MATFEEVRKYLSGQDTLEPMLAQLVGANAWDPGSFATVESGNQQNYLWQPSQEALSKLQGYDFNWNPTGYRNTGTLTATKDGQQVGSWSQKDDSDMKSLGEFAALTGAGFGGLGLAGFGPLSGLGGVGGATQASNLAPLEMVGQASLPAMTPLSAVGPGLGGAGGAAGAAAGGGGLLSSLGGALGGTAGKIGAGLLGGLAGLDATKPQTQTSQQKLDPRMENLLYGQGGLLGQAQQWFNQNQQTNPLMKQGAQMQADFYSNPSYTAGYEALKKQGMGLLQSPIAKNPFFGG